VSSGKLPRPRALAPALSLGTNRQAPQPLTHLSDSPTAWTASAGWAVLVEATTAAVVGSGARRGGRGGGRGQ
jgi:hypothetical protein